MKIGRVELADRRQSRPVAHLEAAALELDRTRLAQLLQRAADRGQRDAERLAELYLRERERARALLGMATGAGAVILLAEEMREPRARGACAVVGDGGAEDR